MTLLGDLLQRLNEPLARYNELDTYYAGRQPLAFLAPESKQALGNRFGLMCSNIPRLVVGSLAERLRITGFTGDAGVWADFLANDLDQQAGVAHREALLLGDSYVIVWADAQGRPQVTVESAKQVATLNDPGTRKPYAGVKRWEDRARKTTELMMYLPDVIVHKRADQLGAVASGFKTVDEYPNPLGVVPVVNLRNTDRIVNYTYSSLFDYGCSEIEDLKPLCDLLNKQLADMAVTSEMAARPRRFATGIELTEEPLLDDAGNPVLDDDDQPVTKAVNPIPEGHRAMISENSDAKFGQLPAADLAGYEASVRVILGQIMAVSTLPAHYVGVFTDNPASADALRASESSLTARAEARQQTFGRAWEQVARLVIAVRDGADPNQVDGVRVQWADAATRSVAQEADAVVKLYQAGLLPQAYALGKLGYSADEITKVTAETPVMDTVL